MKLFVNDLTVMDFSYLCPERGVVGESWIVDIVLDGGLNDESMVQDFGIVKKQLKAVIDEYVDHKLVVPAEYQHTVINHDTKDERVRVDFSYDEQRQMAQLNCPAEAYAFVYSDRITMQSVTSYLKDVIAIHLPENVHDIDIYLREEQIVGEYYHYTHGLKKHDGNCQRIAHGHRSKILISESGQTSRSLQEYWSERFKDIYIGSREDLVQPEQLSFPVSQALDSFCFQYESSQGVFELALSKQACEIIEYDSTVECLAQFVYEQSVKSGAKNVVVRAFEGVGKGAIVSYE